MATQADKQTNLKNMPAHVFQHGDTVQVRHLRDCSPKMVVKRKIMSEGDEQSSKKALDQVVTFWFNKQGDYCERPFYHLDLEVVARAQDSGYTAIAQ